MLLLLGWLRLVCQSVVESACRQRCFPALCQSQWTCRRFTNHLPPPLQSTTRWLSSSCLWTLAWLLVVGQPPWSHSAGHFQMPEEPESINPRAWSTQNTGNPGPPPHKSLRLHFNFRLHHYESRLVNFWLTSRGAFSHLLRKKFKSHNDNEDLPTQIYGSGHIGKS